MEIKQKLWLLRYYLYNLIYIKIGKWFVEAKLPEFENKWNAIYHNYQLKGVTEFLVVGNGPSLCNDDLEALDSLPAIASNKIYLLFESTKWRPELVTICDTLLSYKLRKFKFTEFNEVLCVSTNYFMLSGAGSKRLPWRNISLDVAWSIFEREGKFVPSPITGFFEGFSITNQNIQLAIWLGAKKIYVTGVDHFYQEKKSDFAGVKMKHEGSNHFHKDYRKSGEIVNNAPVKKMDEAYFKMNEIAKALGVEIINISRKTALQAFEVKSADEVVSAIRN